MNIDELMNFDPIVNINVDPKIFVSIGGIILIVLLLCFNVFTVILVKQVNEMSKNVITPAGIPLKIGSKFFLIVGIILTIATVLTIL